MDKRYADVFSGRARANASGEDSVGVRESRDDEYRQGLHDLLVPDIFPLETLNGLAKAERQNRIPLGSGYALWQTILADAPTFHPHFSLFPRAYAIAAATKVAIYDLLYLALAERESCELVTADDRFVKNLQGRFPFIVHLSTLP